MTDEELQKPQLLPIAKLMFPEAQKRIDKRKCPLCGTKINGANNFKDQPSINEYSISGLCQSCQDKTFG